MEAATSVCISGVNELVGQVYRHSLPSGGNTRKGCDCWGLLRLVYADVFGVELPPYACDAKPETETGSGRWVEVDNARIKPFDFLLWRYPTHLHIGIAVDNKNFLHIREDVRSGVERLTENKRAILSGVFRASKI